MTESVKSEVKKIAENLAEDANWEDVMYEIYVRQSVEKGLTDLEKGDIVSHQDIKAKYNLK